MAPKPWNEKTTRERKKDTDALKEIKEKVADDKLNGQMPFLRGAVVTLTGMVETLLKSTEAQDERIEKVEKDLTALQEVRDDVAKLRDEVREWGKMFEEVDSKLKVLSDLDANIKEIQKEQRENVKKLGDAVDRMNLERDEMEKERKRSEEVRLEREKAEVAPCLIVMGLEKGGQETYKQLEQKVITLFKEGLGLNNNGVEADFTKVERFGPGKGGPAAAAAGPERPPLVRITLAAPSMKSAVFGSVANLRGKQQFSRISIQNEVPKGMMDAYKAAVDRAKQLRQDTNVKTRISWAKGPVVVLIKMAGWDKFVPEDKLNEKQTEDMAKAKK